MAFDVLLYRLGLFMKTVKKQSFLITVLAVLLLCAGCGGNLAEDSSVTPGAVYTYTVQVKTEGGMALSGLRVTSYDKSDGLVWTAVTDEDGRISFDARETGLYAILQEVPEGYEVLDSYDLNENGITQISLKTVLSDGSDLTGAAFELGSVVRDFSVTDTNGTAHKISELLGEKKAVVLNFWFINCGPCKSEFPYLQQAYEEYSDEIEVLALNPVDGTDESIAAFGQELGLTFPMSKCGEEWASCFNLTAYPTTVVIDRYGTVAMMHKGSVTDKETFVKIFEFFTSDDYKQTTIRNLSDIK